MQLMQQLYVMMQVIEETPSAAVTPEVRAAMGAQAVALAKAVGYKSTGTCLEPHARTCLLVHIQGAFQRVHVGPSSCNDVTAVNIAFGTCIGQKAVASQVVTPSHFPALVSAGTVEVGKLLSTRGCSCKLCPLVPVCCLCK